jgi:outer membrane protein
LPADTPVSKTEEVADDEALQIALAERPEMAQSDNELENSTDAVGYFRNQLLPDLSLTFTTWSPGQSGIKSIYDNNNPFTGQIIGKIMGSRMDAVNEALKRTYKNWSVNLNLTVPFANIFTRSLLAKAKAEQEQTKVRLEKQKRTIASEVAGAIRSLRNAEKKIKSSAVSREFQEKRLAAELRRYQLGMGTIEWLLTYQRQWANARTSEIRAEIDYRLAVANLERVMGTNLKAKGLKFRDFEF